MTKTSNKDIVLISNGHPLHEISIKSLAGYLEENGINYRTIYLDRVTKLNPEEVERLINLCKNSKLVGFSLMSKDIEILSSVFAELKKLNIPILWGGIHPTAMPKESIEQCDFICVGEGEFPLLSLCNEIISGNNDFLKIPNIGFKKDSTAILPTEFWSISNLDELPYPDYKFIDSYMLKQGQFQKIPFPKDERKEFFGMNTFLFYSARGCPNSCTYCSNSLYHELSKQTKIKWYRTMSAQRVIAEIEHHLNYLPCEFFWFNDDDFLKRDLEEIEKITSFLKEKNLAFNMNATPNVVSKEKMDILFKNGLSGIAFGIQSGSNRILKDLYKRHVYRNKVKTAAEIVAQYYKGEPFADYGFILENPYETNEDIRDTFSLFLDLAQPFSVSLYSLAFFPQTQLTLRALKEKVIEEKDVSINKDYRDGISPSFAHALFEAFYTLEPPKTIFQFMLSNDIFISEETKYSRMLMANYFYNPKIKQIGEKSLKKYFKDPYFMKLKTFAGKKAAIFWATTQEIFSNYKNPDVITSENPNEDLVLKYDSIEIGFNKGQIIRWVDENNNEELFEKQTIKSGFSPRRFPISKHQINFKCFIKRPGKLIKGLIRKNLSDIKNKII